MELREIKESLIKSEQKAKELWRSRLRRFS